MLTLLCVALQLSCFTASTLATLSWATTKTLFVFGDSYSTLGLNITVDAKTVPESDIVVNILMCQGHDGLVTDFHQPQTTSNGLNWVQYLSEPLVPSRIPN